MTPEFSTIQIQEVHHPLFEEKKLTVRVLRLDLIHPVSTGNKFFKLKYNIEEFFRGGYEYLVTFGGAFSNHIVATAVAGKESGFKTIGIIRGDELNENSNAVLQLAKACGMQLFFVSREVYRQVREDQTKLFSETSIPILIENSKLLILPEGGSNQLAVKGCEEILTGCSSAFDYTCCAVGTGGTLAGIAKSLLPSQKAIGIAVLNGESFLEKALYDFGVNRNSFEVNFNYHFGGYGASTPELNSFCETFGKQTGIPVEPVYTGKLFYGLMDLIAKDFFSHGKTIVAIHTGGVFLHPHDFFLEKNL